MPEPADPAAKEQVLAVVNGASVPQRIVDVFRVAGAQVSDIVLSYANEDRQRIMPRTHVCYRLVRKTWRPA